MFVSPRTQFERQLAVMFALVLMGATYFALTLRTALNPVDPGDLISAKRLVATAAGAVVFCVLVNRIDLASARRFTARIPAILALSLAGACAVLVIRIAYDLAFDGGADELLQANSRWLITWMGYFLAAMFGYFAVVVARRSAEFEASETRETKGDQAGRILALAAGLTASERAMLVDRLAAMQVYREADPVKVIAGQVRTGPDKADPVKN